MAPATVTGLSQQQRNELISKAISVRDRAYCPYSHFRVGACLLASDGESYWSGCNVESASYGGTICAERTAVVKAVSRGCTKFIGLVVVSDLEEAISPCGICRQVLREFCPLEMEILLIPSNFSETTEILSLKEASERSTGKNSAVQTTMGELLPMSFGPSQLGKQEPA